ncbi:MAG: universal stress protein [Thermodesulfobacteriaceae bacterium]|nr:universal stress protein [Caldimicrobium sp.]MCX8041560.1 universal stress protein [Thermodesulfobacteriaceae bacterium]MDW8136099.1 universal stress protein [Thermodesulfobacterium sp.]
MIEIKKILVPVDFSEVAPLVAKWAKDFAKKLEAKIYLIYILEDLTGLESIYIDQQILINLEKELLEGAKKSMEEFVKSNFSDFEDLEIIIKSGDVVEKIIETATEKEVDLIVMGTHGRKGLDRILFGSVAEGVVKNSPIPVVTLNPYRGLKEKLL